MAEFTEENVESILLACGEHLAALTESLSQQLGAAYRLEVGESGLWPPTDGNWNGAGAITLFHVGSQAMGVLIPAALPCPEEQRDAWAAEWAAQLLPAELAAEQIRSLAVEDLSLTIESLSPAEWAATLELRVFDAAVEAGEQLALLLVVWPLEQPSPEIATKEAEPSLARRASAPETPPAYTRPPAEPVAPRVDPFARLRQLPVEISVRVAEKKIPMPQLLGITPGMLITFNKSCEDLLDLYVNNTRYCRGEAVKIGENFGLKINQVGVRDEIPHKVIEG